VTYHVQLPAIGTFEAWREAARGHAVNGVAPEKLSWGLEEALDLFGSADLPPVSTGQTRTLNVPKGYLELAAAVICHSDPARFDLLYLLLMRLAGKPGLLHDPSDKLVSRLMDMRKSVRRDSHKMTAFVRFKEMEPMGSRRRFAAWFEPEHLIVERTSPFFARRFGDMDWVIATPSLTASFAGGDLSFDVTKARPPQASDQTDDLWKTYYSHIFNPARLKTKAMMAEMPKKYWKNLPEAELIPGLIASAPERVMEMRKAQPTLPSPRTKNAVLPVGQMAEPESFDSLEAMAASANACRRCAIGAKATQAVCGEGPADADIMFVGEQPGDQEDLTGKPFVGPAGKLFDASLKEAGIERSTAYVTNAVKHFKYVPQGKRRLHQRPDRGEVMVCKWWLDNELKFVKPKLVVALGATAALSLTGNGDAIIKRSGSIETTQSGLRVFLTVHPSSILRIPDPKAAEAARVKFVDDLKSAQAALAA
jgi:uracil-DNA glycosylase